MVSTRPTSVERDEDLSLTTGRQATTNTWREHDEAGHEPQREPQPQLTPVKLRLRPKALPLHLRFKRAGLELTEGKVDVTLEAQRSEKLRVVFQKYGLWESQRLALECECGQIHPPQPVRDAEPARSGLEPPFPDEVQAQTTRDGAQHVSGHPDPHSDYWERLNFMALGQVAYLSPDQTPYQARLRDNAFIRVSEKKPLTRGPDSPASSQGTATSTDGSHLIRRALFSEDPGSHEPHGSMADTADAASSPGDDAPDPAVRGEEEKNNSTLMSALHLNATADATGKTAVDRGEEERQTHTTKSQRKNRRLKEKARQAKQKQSQGSHSGGGQQGGAAQDGSDGARDPAPGLLYLVQRRLGVQEAQAGGRDSREAPDNPLDQALLRLYSSLMQFQDSEAAFALELAGEQLSDTGRAKRRGEYFREALDVMDEALLWLHGAHILLLKGQILEAAVLVNQSCELFEMYVIEDAKEVPPEMRVLFLDTKLLCLANRVCLYSEMYTRARELLSLKEPREVDDKGFLVALQKRTSTGMFRDTSRIRRLFPTNEFSYYICYSVLRESHPEGAAALLKLGVKKCWYHPTCEKFLEMAHSSPSSPSSSLCPSPSSTPSPSPSPSPFPSPSPSPSPSSCTSTVTIQASSSPSGDDALLSSSDAKALEEAERAMEARLNEERQVYKKGDLEWIGPLMDCRGVMEAMDGPYPPSGTETQELESRPEYEKGPFTGRLFSWDDSDLFGPSPPPHLARFTLHGAFQRDPDGLFDERIGRESLTRLDDAKAGEKGGAADGGAVGEEGERGSEVDHTAVDLALAKRCLSIGNREARAGRLAQAGSWYSRGIMLALPQGPYTVDSASQEAKAVALALHLNRSKMAVECGNCDCAVHDALWGCYFGNQPVQAALMVIQAVDAWLAFLPGKESDPKMPLMCLIQFTVFFKQLGRSSHELSILAKEASRLRQKYKVVWRSAPSEENTEHFMKLCKGFVTVQVRRLGREGFNVFRQKSVFAPHVFNWLATQHMQAKR